MLAQPVVTSVIIGARKMSQLEDDLGAVELNLSDEQLAQLDEVSRPAPEYPAWMDVFPSDRRPGEVRRDEQFQKELGRDG